MSDKYFIDTNVLAYMVDTRDSEKQKISKMLVTKLAIQGNCCISTQVLNEFFNVATKKLKYTKEEAKNLILNLMHFEVYRVEISDIPKAIDISIKTQFSYWDSLMILCAKNSKCTIFYSEDLNDGEIVEGVKIVNPFANSQN